MRKESRHNSNDNHQITLKEKKVSRTDIYIYI